MTGYKLTRKNTLAICASAMVLSLVATTQAWSAPATLNDAVTLNEVRTDAKTPVETDPQTQRDNYQYQIDGKDVLDTSKDIAKGDFEYVDEEGKRTNLGAQDDVSDKYIVNGSNGKNYDVKKNETILQGDYTVNTSKGGITLDKIATDKDGNLSKDGYTYKDSAGNDVNLATSVIDRVNAGIYTYLDKNNNEHVLKIVQDANGNYIGVMPQDLVSDSVAVANANTAYGKFTQDQTNYNTSYETWSDDNTKYKNTLNGYTNDVTKWDQYDEYYSTYEDASTQYGEFATDETKYVNYTGSLGGIIDNRAETIAKQTVSEAINGELEGLDGIVGKVDANEENIASNKTAIDKNTTAIADNKTAIEENASAIADNRQDIAKNTAAIDVLNGDVNTEGSVKYTVYNDAQHGKYDGQVLNGSNATTLGTALSDTIGQVNTLNGDVNTAGSVQHTVYNNAENAVYSGTQVTGTSTRATATLGSALSATTEQVNINTGNIATNTANIETNRQNIASNLAKIETNRQSISDLRSDFNAQNVRNEARFSKVEKKIEEVSDEMNKGLASTAALTSLVPLSSRHRTQLSLGMGGYRDKQAVAAGGYHYVAGNVLLNAGVAWGGDNSVSYKAGVTYGF